MADHNGGKPGSTGSSLHDIYNPPPAPQVFEVVGDDEPLVITTSDIAWLLVLCGLMVPPSVRAWILDPLLGAGLTIVGLFVALESWLSGLTFLRRHPAARPLWRGMVFLAATVPWLIGAAFVVFGILALFWLSDHAWI
jgi:hypothetical protein